jgi:hypothetical protein
LRREFDVPARGITNMPMKHARRFNVNFAGVVSALLLVLSLGAEGFIASAFADAPVDLVNGLSARAKAIESGRIAYTFQWQAFRDRIPQPPTVVAETTISFSGSDWAQRTPSSRATLINYDGYLLDFVETRQADGSLRPGATLLPQKSLETRGELNAPPLFAGSFWHREQLRYVEKHAARCIIAGHAVTNGTPVVIVELNVPKEDQREAFCIVSPLLASGGFVRLHVAERLGFVLPKVELLSPDRHLAQSYECAQFEEGCPGVYVPRKLWTENCREDGSPNYRAEFNLNASLINQPIPASEFRVDLPSGTRVQDAREPGSVVAFQLTSRSNSLSLPSHEARDATRGLGPWRNSIVLGLAVGSIASVSLMLAARKQPQPR